MQASCISGLFLKVISSFAGLPAKCMGIRLKNRCFIRRVRALLAKKPLMGKCSARK